MTCLDYLQSLKCLSRPEMNVRAIGRLSWSDQLLLIMLEFVNACNFVAVACVELLLVQAWVIEYDHSWDKVSYLPPCQRQNSLVFVENLHAQNKIQLKSQWGFIFHTGWCLIDQFPLLQHTLEQFGECIVIWPDSSDKQMLIVHLCQKIVFEDTKSYFPFQELVFVLLNLLKFEKMGSCGRVFLDKKLKRPFNECMVWKPRRIKRCLLLI